MHVGFPRSQELTRGAIRNGESTTTVFDQRTNLLYVTIRQTFSLWFVPLYRAPVKLVSVLHLSQRASWDSSETTSRTSMTEGREPAALSGPGQERARYYIDSQEDLYQMNDCIQFLAPGVGPLVWFLWQLWSTGLCIIGAIVFWPLYLVLNREKSSKVKSG